MSIINQDKLMYFKNRKILIILTILWLITFLIIITKYSRIISKPIFYEKIKTKTILNISNINENKTIYKTINDLEIVSKIKTIRPEVFDWAESETNVAINYWLKWKAYNSTANNWGSAQVKLCNTQIPGLLNLNFNNIYWQTVEINNQIKYYLYNAYYDNRGAVKMVRVIASQRTWSKSKLWCLLYFEDRRKPIISKVEKFVQHNLVRGPYETVLFSCIIPKVVEQNMPKAISLIASNTCPTKVHNSLRVIYERPENSRKEFAVCHKSLRFADIDLSLRLIEWLELLSIFGVSKVYFYSLSAHPNMERVLNYYQGLGFVDWKYSTLPGNQINNKYLYRYYHDTLKKSYWPQERLELNDCFYRNLHKYEFIANFDLDEMIVPTKADNWSQMIKRLKANFSKANDIQSFIFQGAKVYSNIELGFNKYINSLNHLHRTHIEVKSPKCIHVTGKAKYLATHISHGCLEGQRCSKALVYPKDGYFLHYRIGFKYNKTEEELKDLIFDPILTKFEKELEKRIEFSLNKIFQ